MSNPTMNKIILTFFISIIIIIIGLNMAIKDNNFLMGTVAICTAFFVGWQTRHDLFLIEFKEMLDLIKKVSDYDKKI